MIDALVNRVVYSATDPLSERIATRTLLDLARLARDPGTPPGVAAIADQAVVDAAARLARGKDAWARSTARMLGDEDRLVRVLGDLPRREPRTPPGMPIGGSETDWMDAP